MSENNKRLAKVMRLLGRILSLPVATFFFVFTIGEFIDTVSTEGLQQAMNVSGLRMGVTIIIALVGNIISFWWLLPAGAILIFAYLFGVISSGLVAVYHVGSFHLNQFHGFWTIPDILYLIAGVLFILSWLLTRKAITTAPPPSLTP
jgi:hypothetical protein